MSKVKFQAAKELIESHHYDEARAILRTIDHPVAADWLAKLDNLAPEPRRRRSRRGRIVVLLLVIIVIGGGVVLYWQRGRSTSSVAPLASANGDVAAAVLPGATALPTFTLVATDAPLELPTELPVQTLIATDAPTQTPTATPCLYSADSIKIIKQFLDTANIASNTNRSALNLVVPNLKTQHQNFQQLPSPDCLKAVNTSIDTGMQFVVWGFQAFQQNQDPLAESYLAQASQSFKEAYNQGVTLGPLAVPDPRMKNTKALWGY